MLRLLLWSIIWSILETVLCVLEKNVYSATVGWKVLYVLLSSFGWNVLFIWSKVWFKLNIFLFIFCLYDLSIVILGYWNLMLLWYCLFLPSDLLLFLIYVGFLMLWVCIYDYYIFSMSRHFYLYIMTFSSLVTIFK